MNLPWHLAKNVLQDKKDGDDDRKASRRSFQELFFKASRNKLLLLSTETELLLFNESFVVSKLFHVTLSFSRTDSLCHELFLVSQKRWKVTNCFKE